MTSTSSFRLLQYIGRQPKADGQIGAVAQLGERLVCNQEATGSIPVSSTIDRP
jgi:hypothetical protein